MHASRRILLQLTEKFMNRPDLVQGPGGNTSYKDEEGRMFIKASGFRFDEMNELNGVSAIAFQPVRDYFMNVIPEGIEDDEKKMLGLISDNVLKYDDGNLYPRPSMETGFHAVLGKYVVHTHSVWCNLFNCSAEKNILWKQLTDKFDIAFIPFVSPGFALSYLIASELKKAMNEGKKTPALFMLENHGVIAHSETEEGCYDLLEKLDDFIVHKLQITKNYPDTSLRESSEGYLPVSEFIPDFILDHQAGPEYFKDVLFPDQIVFFKDQFSKTRTGSHKIILNTLNASIFYNCPLREAKSIHETMTAYLFLRKIFREKRIRAAFVKGEEVEYISNMEMEKHRKNIKS